MHIGWGWFNPPKLAAKQVIPHVPKHFFVFHCSSFLKSSMLVQMTPTGAVWYPSYCGYHH